MKTVGLRELKNRLAEYLRQVRAGETVLITDRGTVVAKIVPPREGAGGWVAARGLAALAAAGELTLGLPNEPNAYPVLPRLLRRRHSSELLDEERGDR